MQQRLTPATALLLTLPPLLWAGNAVIGRLMAGQVPPMTLNFLRWAIAFVLLLPWTGWLLRRDSPLWPRWPRFAVLGLLGVGCYNALQYLALKTSTPLNVTLVAASMPVWMLGFGRLFFGQRLSLRQVAGAVLSIAGVLVVLSRGDWDVLRQVRLVPGDFFVLLATAAWAVYSWLLVRPGDPPEIRGDWAAFVAAQMVFGIAWSGLFAAGEWIAAPQQIAWSWPVAAALASARVSRGGLRADRRRDRGVVSQGLTLNPFRRDVAPHTSAHPPAVPRSIECHLSLMSLRRNG
jgi:drug/metabolite transporter (DMT)-like permease